MPGWPLKARAKVLMGRAYLLGTLLCAEPACPQGLPGWEATHTHTGTRQPRKHFEEPMQQASSCAHSLTVLGEGVGGASGAGDLGAQCPMGWELGIWVCIPDLPGSDLGQGPWPLGCSLW